MVLDTYRAASGTRPDRVLVVVVVVVVVDLPDAKTGCRRLFPHRFFLMTNDPSRHRDAWERIEHDRGRGTLEDRRGECNDCLGNGLSQKSFEVNETCLLLKLLAFPLAGALRGEMASASPHGWDLGRLQQTVLRAGARVVKHGGRLMVDVARAAGVLWSTLWRRMERWWRDPSWGGSRPCPRRWVPPPAHAHRRLLLRELPPTIRPWPTPNAWG